MFMEISVGDLMPKGVRVSVSVCVVRVCVSKCVCLNPCQQLAEVIWSQCHSLKSHLTNQEGKYSSSISSVPFHY